MGSAGPLVAPLPPSRSQAPIAMSCKATTVGSWLPLVSYKASVVLTIAAAVLWFLEPTASHMEGGSRIRNIARNKSLSGLTLCRRDC
jgi:hypothetical protein